MSTTDTSEKGLETLIMRHLTGVDGLGSGPEGVVQEAPLPAGNGWLVGDPRDYDRAHTLDVPQLFRFLETTQPDRFKRFGIADYRDGKDANRQRFLTRLSNELGKRGVIDVLRKGVDHGALRFELSTARLRRETRPPRSGSRGTRSASPGSCGTARAERAGR